MLLAGHMIKESETATNQFLTPANIIPFANYM